MSGEEQSTGARSLATTASMSNSFGGTGTAVTRPKPDGLLSSSISTHTPPISSTQRMSKVRADTVASAPSSPSLVVDFALDQASLPSPKEPGYCPLFCCFYAEFDNIVGPKICFQSPRGFMDQDIGIPAERIHELLQETFDNAASAEENKEQVSDKSKRNNTDSDFGNEHEESTVSKEAVSRHHSSRSLSIFDSTSEFIITGNELAGKIISLSTHNLHILTRPTLISDERYERNALFFCVGFVLRRAEDPRPFRPILSKWALTLRSMEIEYRFLSQSHTRERLQTLLERLLISLNSPYFECSLLFNPGNVLNLKLFRPPRAPAVPVPEHAVPILLRKDWQIHMYDWDLAINWVVLHIDGVTNARQISKKSEVDMEMVLACLRVLKHHDVIALVDMFFYSNRYEFTPRATSMLAGKEPKLLQEAIEFCRKGPPFLAGGPFPSGGEPGLSPRNIISPDGRSPPMNSPSRAATAPLMSYPPKQTGGTGNTTVGYKVAMARMAKVHDTRDMELAIAELYCACTRNASFGDIWVALTSSDLPVTDESLHSGAVNESGATHGRTPTEYTFLEMMGMNFQKCAPVDWTEVFQWFDHRRFAAFGVVHGLLVRMHNFPFARDNGAVVEGRRFQHAQGLHGTSYVGSYQKALEIAEMMDGTHCDDDLVCTFEMPLDQLIDIVERVARKKVVSVYTIAKD